MNPFWAPPPSPPSSQPASGSATGALAAIVYDDGQARGYGAILIRDGASSWLLVATGAANASCADRDDDGVGGLVRLTFGLRDFRTGETFTGVISPMDGEVDKSGRVKARLHFERDEPSDQAFDGLLRVRFFDHQH